MGFFARAPLDVTAALLTSISADGPGITAEQLKAIAVPALVIATCHGLRPSARHGARASRASFPAPRLSRSPRRPSDRDAYVAEFRAALNTFLTGFLP